VARSFSRANALSLDFAGGDFFATLGPGVEVRAEAFEMSTAPPPLSACVRGHSIGRPKMRVLGLAFAGLLALTAPIVAYALPLAGKTGSAAFSPAPGIVNVWGGCGRGWHPVPGHWSQWRDGWVPPHCAPNDYGRGWEGPYGGQPGPYGGWGGNGGGQGPYGGWRNGSGWVNPQP
jgi:hypothetical protein